MWELLRYALSFFFTHVPVFVILSLLISYKIAFYLPSWWDTYTYIRKCKMWTQMGAVHNEHWAHTHQAIVYKILLIQSDKMVTYSYAMQSHTFLHCISIMYIRTMSA